MCGLGLAPIVSAGGQASLLNGDSAAVKGAVWEVGKQNISLLALAERGKGSSEKPLCGKVLQQIVQRFIREDDLSLLAEFHDLRVEILQNVLVGLLKKPE